MGVRAELLRVEPDAPSCSQRHNAPPTDLSRPWGCPAHPQRQPVTSETSQATRAHPVRSGQAVTGCARHIAARRRFVRLQSISDWMKRVPPSPSSAHAPADSAAAIAAPPAPVIAALPAAGLPVALAAFMAVVLPPMVAFNLSPSATLLNQLASVAGFGLWLVIGMRGSASLGVAWRATMPLVSALVLMALAAMGSWVWGSLPFSLTASSAGLIVAAALVMLAAAAQACAPVALGAPGNALSVARPVFVAFAWAMLAAGVLSAIVGMLQVFMPSLTDGDWIARSGLPGRAVGNLRQPNHLATLLMWSMIAWVPLSASKRLHQALALPVLALLTFAVLLTASRTGWVGLALMVLWAVADRRLPRFVRLALLAAPIVYALGWLAMSQWATLTSHTFGGQVRLAEADVSSSRFKIWPNTLAMIVADPWLGVGWGQFNFAWTLSAFPTRPVAFFDHTHNLPLQLLVELGLPLGSLVLLLGIAALVQAARRSVRQTGEAGVFARASLVMVLMVCAHSQFEYPLWYAHFLLPAAFAWGHALGRSGLREAAARARRRDRRLTAAPTGLWPVVAGALMVGASIGATADYLRVVAIFAPGADAAPLADRIAEGRNSVFFGHHGDYAAATSGDDAAVPLATFDRVTHFLLDARLMMAWSRSLAAHHDLERARHVAARLKEFRNPATDGFFAVCDVLAAATDAKDEAEAAAASGVKAPSSSATGRDNGVAPQAARHAASAPLPPDAALSAASAPALPPQCEAPATALRWSDFL
jgi:hypothetical protein